MENKDSTKAGFRYDINALRAIAVLGVLFFHYKVSFLTGGFAGVDVFFVISGYLMTKIVINSISTGNFSFRDYLFKRVKRILPVLLFVTFSVSFICFFFYLPVDYKVTQMNALASIAFLSNILYWQNADSYFAASSDTNLFLHTWSLSVEWQFYLIYPFILLILNRIIKNNKLYFWFFLILTILLAVFSFYVTIYKSNASFYLLPTRAWEMLFGGVAFHAEIMLKGYRWRRIAAGVGYALIGLCFLFLDAYMPWPSLYTLLPVTATFLVIIANLNTFKLVEFRGIQFLGKISYSLYLWHWPVYVIAQYFGIRIGLESTLLLVSMSVLLGYLSFIYIESAKIKNERTIIAVASVGAVIIAVSMYFNANRIMFKDNTLSLSDYSNTHMDNVSKQFRTGICFVEPGNEIYKPRECLCLDNNKRNILLIGDSHAAQLSESLRSALDSTNFNLLQATAGGIVPAVKKPDGQNPNLRKVIDYIYEKFVPENANKIYLVIITAHWAGIRNMKKEVILQDIRESISYFHKRNIKVIVIGQSESYIISYPVIAGRNYEYGIKVNRNYLNQDDYLMDNFLSRNLGTNYVRVINKYSFPALSENGDPYMWDNNHTTKYGADLIVSKMLSNATVKKMLK